MDQYVRSLQPIPSPYLTTKHAAPTGTPPGQLTLEAQRGRALFIDPAVGCATCHRGPLFTDLKPHAVETGKYDERGDIFYNSDPD